MPSKTVVKGFEGLEKALTKYGESVDKELADHVKITSQKIRNEAIKMIQHGAKTGKVYKKYHPSRLHKASAQGEAPATDTGFLASNIFSDFKGKKAKVTSKANYSNFLEVSLKRPFIIPAMENTRSYWNDGIINIVKTGKRKI